jgi:large subunit ribosomal protein L9
VQEYQQLAQRISAEAVTVFARVGDQGRLYGSVTAADVAAALKKLHGRDFDKRDVEVADPIRHLGTHTVRVHVAPNLTASLKVEVQPEA